MGSTLTKNVAKPQSYDDDAQQDNGQMQPHYSKDTQLTINVNQDSQQKMNSNTHNKRESNFTHNLNGNVTLAKPKTAKANTKNMTQINSQILPLTKADKITTTQYQTNSQRMLTHQSPFGLNTIGANKMNDAKRLTNNSLDEAKGRGHHINMDTIHWATHANAAHKQQSPLNGIRKLNAKQTLRTNQRELDAHGDNTMLKHMFKITSLIKTIGRLPNTILSTQLNKSDQQLHGAASVVTATNNNMNDQIYDHSTHYNVESETPVGEKTMSTLKTTTKYLIKRCGTTLSRTRDKFSAAWLRDMKPTAVTTPMICVAKMIKLLGINSIDSPISVSEVYA